MLWAKPGHCSLKGHDSVLTLVMITTSKTTVYDAKESTVLFFGGGTNVVAKHFGGKKKKADDIPVDLKAWELPGWNWSLDSIHRGQGNSKNIQSTLQVGRCRMNQPGNLDISCCFCCCSVTKSCLTLCDPTDCSTPDFPVFHYLPEFAQTRGHWVGDAT